MIRLSRFYLLYSFLIFGGTVPSYEPQINYFDGISSTDTCVSKLERRVAGLSGLLISHQLYGSLPYNASKNCFLLITAPLGYRIRLRALDFNVLGDSVNCDKDTLHVFDHEKAIDPHHLSEASEDDTSPGPILGQFCGLIRNTSEMAVSTENALTLWWHSDAHLPLHHNGEGFRLLWSAFRKSSMAPCNSQREFTCNNQECIPAELACNRYADCKDESDLIRELQIANKCEHVDDDLLGSLTGFTLLLICMAVVSSCACICICVCACCKCMKAPNKPSFANSQVEQEEMFCQEPSAAQPTPPDFYPPSPPKNTLPKNAYSSQKNQRTSHSNGLMHHSNQQVRYARQPGVPFPQAVRVANKYGSPEEKLAVPPNDYTYVRNETRHLLI